MIYLDLVLNLTLLVAFSVVSGFVENRAPRETRSGQILQGLLFGGAAVLGMLRPVDLGPGLLLDGRSVMVSLCALFFGPWAAATAVAPPIVGRLLIGGPGTWTGILMILSSAGIGLAARVRENPEKIPPSTPRLCAFGLAVHLVMLLAFFTLPEGAGWSVVRRIGLPILVLYPLATVLAGKTLSDQVESRRRLEAIQESAELFRTIFEGSRDAIFIVRKDASFAHVNSAARSLTGYSAAELRNLRIPDLHAPEDTGAFEEFFERILDGEAILSEADILRRDGSKVPVEFSNARVTIGGEPFMHTVARDISARKRAEEALRESENRYRLLFEYSDILVSVYDCDGACRLMNRNVAELFGGSPEEFQGRSLRDLHPESGPEYRRRIREAIDTGRSREYEDRVPFPSGPRWLHSRVHPIPDPDGIRRTAQIVSLDVTARKRAERELRESERMKDLILESTSEFVVYMDADFRMIWTNRAAAESAGRTAESLVGKRCHEIWHGRSEPCRACPAVRTLAEKIPQEGEIRTADGRYWSIRSFPVPDESGDVSGVVEFGRDITGPKRAEAERKRLEDHFRRAQRLESVGKLAGGVAHELNNMLTPVIGHAEMLLEEAGGDPDRAESLREIVAAGSRARDLVRQLLAFARKQPLRFQPVDLNVLLRNFEPLLRRVVGETVEIRMNPAPILSAISGDAAQLEQAAMNLAENARDAMPGGGILTLETREADLDRADLPASEDVIPGRYVLLTVEDTGSGMDSQTRERLFEPFFTTRELGKGTGLGLAAVHGIVKQHGGHIRIFSEPGIGTTFKVYLPVSGEFSETESADADRPSLPSNDSGALADSANQKGASL